jgi:hypothetical protein
MRARGARHKTASPSNELALGIGMVFVGGLVFYLAVTARVRPLEIHVTPAAQARFTELLQMEGILGDACIKLDAQDIAIDDLGVTISFVSRDRADLQYQTTIGDLPFVANYESGRRLSGVTIDVNDDGDIEFRRVP